MSLSVGINYRDKVDFIGRVFKGVYMTRTCTLSVGAPAFGVAHKKEDIFTQSFPAIMLIFSGPKYVLVDVQSTKCTYTASPAFSSVSYVHSSTLLSSKAELLETHPWNYPEHPT